MLKKKIHSLVTQKNLATGGNFEIIHDSNAVHIIGGVGSCPVLTKCGTYTGGCPNLSTCGTYDPGE